MTAQTTESTSIPTPAPKREPASPTKSLIVGKLLKRPRGATGAELAQATGWQPHTVRAHLSVLRKKGASLVRETRKSGEASYRIVASTADVPAADTAIVDADGAGAGVDHALAPEVV
jgi:hypothetical protein